MAHDDNKVIDAKLDDDVISPNELQNAFDELYVKFLETIMDLKTCKKSSKANLEYRNKVVKENKGLIVENKTLKCKLEEANGTTKKYSKSKEVLKNIVEFHMCPSDKSG